MLLAKMSLTDQRCGLTDEHELTLDPATAGPQFGNAPPFVHHNVGMIGLIRSIILNMSCIRSFLLEAT
jgi:hypothetical protein